ncbi:hypothetical protein BV898_16030 [Hypsibius exemplaris]|uniref:Aquaporin n=1 Tax=Hypsibius exemplaris TaxID=2072580 RepID=A0A9X6NJ44_HYPEX|nr:hypothetical protein BV898_16030 [Hypsibius exemplaris]
MRGDLRDAVGPVFDFASTAPPWVMMVSQVVLTTAVVRISQAILDQNNPLFRLLEEFICVFQTIVFSYELGVIRRAYGPLLYSVALFLAIMFYARLYRRFVFNNPAVTVHKYIAQRGMSDVELVQHIGVQVAAAWVGFMYVHWIWASPLSEPVHKEQLALFVPCKSFINVSLVNAILVETTIAFIVRFVAHGGAFGLPLGRYGPVFPALACVACTLIGFSYTGGFYNPTLAFSMQYNCSGHDNWEFAAVYVAGPLIASFIVGLYGDAIWRRLKPRDPATSE